MGWKMLVFVAFVQLLVYVSASVPQMSLVREWESVDLLVPGKGWQETSRRPIDLNHYTFNTFWKYLHPDVYNDRLFVTCYLNEAPFSLAYHNLSDTSNSLLLQPYPSWDAHSDEHGNRQIHDVLTLRIDRCGRLWVIDRVDGVDELYRIFVFDLNTDRILRKHTVRYFIEFLFGISMVVDDDDCENPYLYISGSAQGGIWTYSWAEETLWHHPGDTVTGMVIAPNKSESHSIVYYNKFDVEVWYISTKYLRDNTSNLLEFEHIGEHDFYLGSTAFDAKNNVLFVSNFYNSTTIIAYPCWNGYVRCDPSGRHEIAVNTTHSVTQIILNKNGNLWAFTETSTFKDNTINLSIFSLDITSADVEKNKNNTTNTTKLNETATAATDSATSTIVQVPGVDYDDINITKVTIETTPAVTIEEILAVIPNSTITATDPVSSTKMQASGVDYDRISNITVTIEDITGGTPNSNITATNPASSTTEQTSGVDYDDINNTTVTIEDITGRTPISNITTTDPASSTTEQTSGVDYDDINNTTVTIEDITGRTPISNITITDPASSTTEQTLGVDYDDINNTTVTIEDITGRTPISNITITDPASSTTEQTLGVDYDDINNTTVTIEDITGRTPISNITTTDPASSTTEQTSGVDYDDINNTTVTIEDTLSGTPKSDVKTQANGGGNKMNQFAKNLFNFTNNTFIFFNFTIN